MSRYLLFCCVIFTLLLPSNVEASFTWEQIESGKSNLQYLGKETRSIYKWRYDQHGTINSIRFYGETQGYLRHFDFGALVHWSDYNDVDPSHLIRKLGFSEASNIGSTNVAGSRYFNRIKYNTFDSNGQKCFVFDQVYNQLIDRVLG